VASFLIGGSKISQHGEPGHQQALACDAARNHKRAKWTRPSLRCVFESLRQFLVAFRNFEHYPLGFRIAEGFGQSRRLFTAFSQFAGQE